MPQPTTNLPHTPVLPTTNRPRNAGKSMSDDASRLDAIAKVTGRAKYGRDRYLPNSLFAAFIRSPWGAGKLATVDLAAARAVPGVLEVELDETRARGGTRYHGQNVGHIIAESLEALRRAQRALNASWRRGLVTTRIDDGMEEAGPDAAGAEPNEDTVALLAQCDHVHEAIYTTEVQTHSSLETHGAAIDHNGQEAIVYASTQGTFSAADGLDEPLGLPRAKFKVICEYVGGGFGSKLGGAGKESTLAARAAAKYKRPCWCFCNREEEHLDTGNRPSARVRVRVGFDKDGSIKGGFMQTWGGVGAARGGGGVRIPTGRYDLGQIQLGRHVDVSFNAGTPRAMRAPGCPQGAFAEELMLDEIAAAAGVDPLTLRLRICTLDDRKKMLEAGAEMIGWRSRPRTGSQTGAIRRGMGVGSCAWGHGRARSEAEVVIAADGSVLCKTGSQDIGTGQRTAMAIVAAEALGVPLPVVSVLIGDSTLPIAPGSGGSVTLANTAPSMAAAASDARTKLLELVAKHAEAPVAELSIEGGEIKRNHEPLMTWAQGCAKIGPAGIVGRGENSPQRGPGHSEGVQFVDLRVDTQTGIVYVDRIIAFQSCGRVVCRKTAESQIIGAVIQGLSFALFENRLLDRNTGAMVNPNMEYYKIAGPGDMPLIEPVLWSDGQTVVKPLGEPPVIPTAGAIACAIFNALGTPVRSLPLTPDKLLAVIG
ncbi:MAG: xanthine dehydrogenase family protein molybdopterin-binding subunit [Phycisphaerales bacterium]